MPHLLVNTDEITAEGEQVSRILPNMIAKQDGKSSISQFFPTLNARHLYGLSIAFDSVIVLFSFIIAKYLYEWYFAWTYTVVDEYVYVACLCALVHYFVTTSSMKAGALLKPRPFSVIARHLAISFSIVLALGFALKISEAHSRIWFGLAFALSLLLLWVKHEALIVLSRRAWFRAPAVEYVALYGAGPACRALKTALEAESNGYCEAIVYEQEFASVAGSRASLNELLRDGLGNRFSRVVVCLPHGKTAPLADIFNALACLPVRIDVHAPPAGADSLLRDFQIPTTRLLLNLDQSAPSEWGLLAKRFVDLIFGSLLLLLFAPLMLIAAIAIKLEDGGPIFFRQRRHGWNHSVISVWKFRTMRVLEDGPVVVQARRNDPRVTRVGAFLRKTSIDELPQFFNVLSGNMSLVGPRPHALAHNVHYSEHIDSYAVRHKVKPGITGWAQIKGLRGNSENIEEMVRRADADRWYIRNWSLALDFKVLIFTPFAPLTQRNAF